MFINIELHKLDFWIVLKFENWQASGYLLNLHAVIIECLILSHFFYQVKQVKKKQSENIDGHQLVHVCRL